MDGLFRDTITDEEAEKLKYIFADFLKGFTEIKDNNYEIFLSERFIKYMPEKSSEEIRIYVKDLLDTIRSDNINLSELQQQKSKGIKRDAWFAGATKKALSHTSAAQTVEYYNILSETVQKANESMYNTIMTKNGSVNMNPNLDGFIAEREHVNSFNMNAAVRDKSIRAQVVEHSGEAFTKNGVDVVVTNTKTGKTVQRYQLKYCKDADATENAFQHGDYRGQRSLVPSDQLQEIQKNGRSKATDRISYDGVTSEPLSKSDAKQLQNDARNNCLNEKSWNDFKMTDLAKGVGKQVANAALMGAAITTGAVIAEKVMQGEEIESGEIIETAIVSGADTGVKAAVAGSLVVASEKGIIKAIPKGTSANAVTNLAFIAVENFKVFRQVAKGDINISEGLSRMCDVTVSAAAGIAGSSIIGSLGIGAAVSLVCGPAAGVVAGFAAGTIGYMAGAGVGKVISKGIQIVAKGAEKAVKTAGRAIIETGRKIVNTAKGIFSSLKNGIKAIFS